MNLIPYQKTPQSVTESVVSVGNFDGVHLGHEALIKEVVKRAKDKGLASVIVTFEPHTRSVVPPGSPQPVLSTLEEKAFLMARLGVDYLAWIPFDRAFAELSSADFVEKVITRALRAGNGSWASSIPLAKRQAGTKTFCSPAWAETIFTSFP